MLNHTLSVLFGGAGHKKWGEGVCQIAESRLILVVLKILKNFQINLSIWSD